MENSKDAYKKVELILKNYSLLLDRINQQNMEKYARIAELASRIHMDAFVRQFDAMITLQQATFQQNLLPKIETYSEIIDKLAKFEIEKMNRIVESLSFYYQEYIDNVSKLVESSIQNQMVKYSQILQVAYVNAILSYSRIIQPGVEVSTEITLEQKRQEESISRDIDSLLIELNSDFLEMKKGAWITFSRKGPDYLRQSISSIRELLSHILRRFAPNEKTRKDRIRKILESEKKHGSEVDFIESVADFVDELYNLLSKVEHTLYKEDIYVEMAMKSVEAVLVVIIINGLKK